MVIEQAQRSPTTFMLMRSATRTDILDLRFRRALRNSCGQELCIRRPNAVDCLLMHADEGGFVALNPETGTTTQEETVDEAADNLREARAIS